MELKTSWLIRVDKLALPVRQTGLGFWLYHGNYVSFSKLFPHLWARDKSNDHLLGCYRSLNEMVDVNPSTQNLAHCWYLTMRKYYYYCYHFLIIDSYLSSEHPLPSRRTPCSAGIWVMLTLLSFLILQKEKLRPRESHCLDSFILKKCAWFSLFPCHYFHSH